MIKRAKTSTREPDANTLPSGGKEDETDHDALEESAVFVSPALAQTEIKQPTDDGPQQIPAGDEPIVLDPVITIAEAVVLKELLLPHSNRPGVVCIDGSRVAAVDTAGLQVLLAFVRTLQKQGSVVRWVGMSDALQNTAQLLGVAVQLGLRT